MRFWQGLIGFLSLGRVGLVEERNFVNLPNDLVTKCVSEIFCEIEKGHVIEIKAISTSYLPGCFELFTTEDKPAKAKMILELASKCIRLQQDLELANALNKADEVALSNEINQLK